MPETKKIICPCCGSKNIAKYLYGMPIFDEKLMQEELEGKVIFAGCIITDNDPKYHCHDCGKDFNKTISEAEEKILEFAKQYNYEAIDFIGKWNGYHVYAVIKEKYPNPFRELTIGYPAYILVKNKEIKFFLDDKLEITDFFYSEDTEEDDDENIDSRLTPKGKYLYYLLKQIKDDWNFYEETIGLLNSDEEMQEIIDLIEYDGEKDEKIIKFCVNEIFNRRLHNAKTQTQS